MSQPPPEIIIPEHLKPQDGRFGSGPSRLRPQAIEELQEVSRTYLGTSHRRPTVRAVVQRLQAGLRELLKLPEDWEILLGNGGATQFWDAACFGLIDQQSCHFCFGEFSEKFYRAASQVPHLQPPVQEVSPHGSHPEITAHPGVDAYALTHNETSAGVAMELRRPPGTKAEEALVLVDATSAAGGMRFDPVEIDVYYFSPQKCFGADGGLWLAGCSPAASSRIEQLHQAQRWTPPTLDLHIALENSRLHQTYNTPALATIYLTLSSVEWMLAQGGLDWTTQRCAESAAVVYDWAEKSDFATPFVAEPYRSPVVATIDFSDDIQADDVAAVLRANGIVDVESYRKLGRNQLRISLFPIITPEEEAALCACIDYVVSQL